MAETEYKDACLYPVVLCREGDVWGYHNSVFGGGGAATQADALALARDMLCEAVKSYAEQGVEPPPPSDPDDIDLDNAQVAWLPAAISRFRTG